MKRDFSAESKNKILGMVDAVNREKISNFSDWVGDKYYTFQEWIGVLSIRNYLSNISAYQKKMIDKNNSSKKSIESIFNKVNRIDDNYQKQLSSARATLSQCDTYLTKMTSAINPSLSSYDLGRIDLELNKLNEQIEKDLSNSSENDKQAKQLYTSKNYINAEKTTLKTASGILNFIGKKKKDYDASLIGSILSHLSTLCGLATKDTTNKTEAASSLLSLFKASGKMELGVYKYYEKKLPVMRQMKLDKKYGKTMTGISLATSVMSVAGETIDTYKVFSDSNSNVYDKSAQALEMTGSVFETGVNGYSAVKGSEKYLRYVDSISGSKKAVNQILIDDRELKYTTSAATSKSIEKASTVLAIGSVIVSTVSGGIKQWGKVSADGKVDLEEGATVGMYGALSGLDTVTSSLSLGIVHFDSEKVGQDLEKRASDFSKSDRWGARVIRDQLRKGKWYNNVAAFGVSMGSGAVMLGEKVIDDTKASVKAVGGWISTGWNYVKSGIIKKYK